MSIKAERYEGIDGLKAYAIIGIALMHVLANGEYWIGGFVFERLIPSFTNLVFLFMMVSGFGMCCGYYQKIIDQKIRVRFKTSILPNNSPQKGKYQEENRKISPVFQAFQAQ